MSSPRKAARLQAPGAQPHAHPIEHQHLEPVCPAVGEHVGVVGLRAQREAVHHLGQQFVDAPAQVTSAQGQPDAVDADHRLNSRISLPNSAAWASGQYSSSRVAPQGICMRTVADAVSTGAR